MVQRINEIVKSVIKKVINEKLEYNIAAKLIDLGYLIHCTPNDFDSFDEKYIKGGMRAKEGRGFYFSDMPYKSIEYGDNVKLIRKDDFNWLDAFSPIDLSILSNEAIDIEICRLNDRLDYVRNVREWNYINSEIEKLKNQKIDDELEFYIKITIRNGAKTYGQLEYLINNPTTMIPKLQQIYINHGYDGYSTDGIYTVFNVKKLNNQLIKNSDEVIRKAEEN